MNLEGQSKITEKVGFTVEVTLLEYAQVTAASYPSLYKKFCHYTISGYHSNELWSVNTLYECKLCGRSRTCNEYFVSVYRVYCVWIIF
jgi:hypothetical protein